METTDLIKKIKKIEIKTRGISKDIFSGDYHSVFKGKGMAFSEVREYQVGDEIREIDWNVTARFNHPFVKVFEEERELTVMLLVDVSESESFGTSKQFKKSLITELCAVLSFSAIQNNDKIGVIFFSDKVEKFIPPKKGRSHILRIIHELIEFKPENKKTDIGEALRYLINIVKKRSIVFLLSDFISQDFEDALKLAGKKHDTIALRIYDRRETELPNVGLVRAKDAETGKMIWINTSKKSVRKHYEESQLEREKDLKRIFSKNNIDEVKIRVDQSYVAPLSAFFKNRGKRR